MRRDIRPLSNFAPPAIEAEAARLERDALDVDATLIAVQALEIVSA